MPARTPTICGHPGCPEDATADGRCDLHRRKAWANRSPSSRALAGNAEHQRARRKASRRAGGRCERCGRESDELQLHHPHWIADGGPVVQADAPMLCPTCHDQAPRRGVSA